MKTGVVLVVHGAYGAPLIDAGKQLLGSLDLSLIEVTAGMRPAEIREQIHRAAAEQGSGQGILFVTDICGSTPANICLQLLGEHSGSELVTGVNLPMLVKLSTCDRGLLASTLAQELRRTAQRSIQLGSELLHKGATCGD
jgi:mannose/fructose-specific phosphotransferase system component IIA